MSNLTRTLNVFPVSSCRENKRIRNSVFSGVSHEVAQAYRHDNNHPSGDVLGDVNVEALPSGQAQALSVVAR